MTNEIEYLRELSNDMKRWKKVNNDVNRATNALSVCDDADVADCRLAYVKAKTERENLRDELGDARMDEIERLSARNKRRWMRVRSAVRALMKEQHPVLVTLTFDNETLFSTNETSRRTYVRKFLSSQTFRYFANRDFGAKNNREHYHAICATNINPKEWSYGTCNVKAIKKPSEDDKETVSRLAKYVDKLTNHALKETAEDRIIWSRGFSHKPCMVETFPDDEEFLAWLDTLGG